MHVLTVRTSVVCALAALALLGPGATRAQQPPHYTYVEGGYTDVDRGDLPFDSGDGWYAGGSLRLKGFHLFAEYSKRSLDQAGGGASLEQKQWLAGLGWHGLMGPSADLVVEAAYVDNAIAFSMQDRDDTGYFGQLGLRWRFARFLEVDGFYRYLDIADDTQSLYLFDAIAWIKNFGIGVAWEKQDAADSYNFFLRFNIGG